MFLKGKKKKKQLLKYSFINNSILLTMDSINRNGFVEVCRQKNKEHSIQILCFNQETGEFKAFDRFHWMNEPFDMPFIGMYRVYDEDLWTPIELHYTLEWLKEHLVSDIN